MGAGRWLVGARCAVYAGVVTAVVYALFATVLMVTLHRLASERQENLVDEAASRIAFEVERGNLPDPLPHWSVPNLQVVGQHGNVVAASAPMRGRPSMAPLLPLNAKSSATATVCTAALPSDGCDIVTAQRVYRDGQNWTVFSAAPTVTPLLHPGLAAVLIGGITVLTAVVAYSCYRIVGISLIPMHAIRTELDDIGIASPGRRVPLPPYRDEIHDLAESVNNTLVRLQEALERQRQFASDACHDLRSPITAMRAEVEEALMAPGSTIAISTGENLLANLDRLQAIIGDLLVIARLDTAMPGARDPVDLAELVATELDIRSPSTKRIELLLRPGVVVLGDWLRLARLLTNLVSNAERHANGRITVKVYQEEGGPSGDSRFADGTAVLEVIDDGAGIPPDKRDKVFQRFVRLGEGRRREPGGTGLGLPIVRQIAEMSGGTVTIEDSPRGARFVLRLPLVRSGVAEPPHV